MTKRWRHTSDQIIRKLAEGHKLPAGGAELDEVCRRLEPAKVEELIQGYSDGVPVDELAGRFQVDQSTVQKHARRHDLPRRSPRLGPNQTEEAARLYLAGPSLAKLTKHFGVATDTVALALRRAGVTLRPRRGWKY